MYTDYMLINSVNVHDVGNMKIGLLENADTFQLPSRLYSSFTDNLYTDSQYVSENITCKHIDVSVQGPILTDIMNELHVQCNLEMYTQEQHNEQGKSENSMFPEVMAFKDKDNKNLSLDILMLTGSTLNLRKFMKY